MAICKEAFQGKGNLQKMGRRQQTDRIIGNHLISLHDIKTFLKTQLTICLAKSLLSRRMPAQTVSLSKNDGAPAKPQYRWCGDSRIKKSPCPYWLGVHQLIFQ